MITSPVALGIIGTGEITRLMRPAFTGSGRVRVIAVADVNAAAARAEADALGGAEVFTDYRALLAHPRVQAVYIATPPFLHVEMVLAALAAGKHVLCEKPFTLNHTEARAIAAAHAASPALHVACCSSRFQAGPAVRAARAMIASGAVGRVQHIRFVHTLAPPTPLATMPAWKQSRATAGGGRLMDWGVYYLDWLRFLLGPLFDPKIIFGRTENWCWEEGDIDSGFSAELLLGSGITITLECRVEHGPALQRIELRATNGGLDLPFMPGAASSTLTLHRYDAQKSLHSEACSKPLDDWAPILHYPLHDFIDALMHARPCASPPDSQIMIHAVIDALYASAAAHRAVEVSA